MANSAFQKGTPDELNDIGDVSIATPAQGEVIYYNGTNYVALGVGTNGQVLQTQGAAANPQWATAGAGDVTKVGTPVNNQVGVWTGDGTIEGDSNFTWDGTDLSLNAGTNSVNATELGLLEGLTTLSGSNTGDEAAASDSTAGVVELATAAETTTGTDTGRAVTPDGLAGSDFGIRYVSAICFDFTTDTATGDGKFYFHVPAAMDGMNLVEVHAEVITAGTTGTTDIQIHNVDNALDMLSTKLTIDSAETGSDTAAAAAVINASNDHVNENDVVRIDVDAVSTTAAKGLIVTMGFQLP